MWYAAYDGEFLPINIVIGIIEQCMPNWILDEEIVNFIMLAGSFYWMS